jgi:predicted Fe-S protein YdhL (DUF1289 family)
MNWVGRTGFWLAALLGAPQLFFAAPADEATAGQSGLSGIHAPVPPAPPTQAPPVPSPRSPVVFFRELLAMTALERKKALADRSPESQRVILAKVLEYALLDPDLREERLQVTELRWYLLPLMTAPAANRAEQLARVPARMRELVEVRLREWDKLPPDAQQELLAKENILRHFAEIEGRSEEVRRKVLEGLSPARRQKLQEGIEQWNRLPEDQRRKITRRFYQFFDLTAAEKEKALRTLSVPERRQIEKTLQTFESLPHDQRAACIHAFEQFAGLSLQERQQFLKNAEHWKLMTPAQRQAWRDVVKRLPPPLPPDLPPVPPSHPWSHPVPAVATNGH